MFQRLRSAAAAVTMSALASTPSFAHSASDITVPEPQIAPAGLFVRVQNRADLVCKFDRVANDIAVLLVPVRTAQTVPFAMAAQVANGGKAYFVPNADRTAMDVTLSQASTGKPVLSDARLDAILDRYDAFVNACNAKFSAFVKASAPRT